MSSSSTAPPKAIAFFGATGGCGLSVLKRALAAGHTCVALARTPAKFDALLPPGAHPNLTIKPGNAHVVADVAACLVHPSDPARLVDLVCFSIGGALNMAKLSLDDPDVCKKGMDALLAALALLRESDHGLAGRPRLLVVSTTGISAHARDVPLVFLPMYHVMLKQPHADKKVMEEHLVAASTDVAWTLVRPSLLTDGEGPKPIRVGVEDPHAGVETKAIGYTISRDDVGRWIFEELVQKEGQDYLHKAVSITW